MVAAVVTTALSRTGTAPESMRAFKCASIPLAMDPKVWAEATLSLNCWAMSLGEAVGSMAAAC